MNICHTHSAHRAPQNVCSDFHLPLHIDLNLESPLNYLETWRIIPASKWLVTLIYKPWMATCYKPWMVTWEQPYLGNLLTMVINHLKIWDDHTSTPISMKWKYHRHQQQLSTNHITHHGFLFISTHVIHHRITTSHHRNPCTLHKKNRNNQTSIWNPTSSCIF